MARSPGELAQAQNACLRLHWAVMNVTDVPVNTARQSEAVLNLLALDFDSVP